LQRDYWQTREKTTFSIGLDADAPDAVAARKVADFLATEHMRFIFSRRGYKILDKLIWHLETYDVTSIRASTPMYFLSKPSVI
jgi:asparagine synthase (glutamine-hydrolysing)